MFGRQQVKCFFRNSCVQCLLPTRESRAVQDGDAAGYVGKVRSNRETDQSDSPPPPAERSLGIERAAGNSIPKDAPNDTIPQAADIVANSIGEPGFEVGAEEEESEGVEEPVPAPAEMTSPSGTNKENASEPKEEEEEKGSLIDRKIMGKRAEVAEEKVDEGGGVDGSDGEKFDEGDGVESDHSHDGSALEVGHAHKSTSFVRENPLLPKLEATGPRTASEVD